ncbi:uncharacterized protein [Palaemon carinicauda]
MGGPGQQNGKLPTYGTMEGDPGAADQTYAQETYAQQDPYAQQQQQGYTITQQQTQPQMSDYTTSNPHNPFAASAAAAPAPVSNPFSGGFSQEAVQPQPGQYTQGQY